MTTILLEPTATMYIQQEPHLADQEDADNVEANGFILGFKQPAIDSDGGIPFSASISHAIGNNQAIGAMEMQIDNLTREEVESIPRTGLIRLDAGYNNVPGLPEQPIFFGLMQRPVPKRSGGKVTWSVAAVNVPTVLFGSRVLYEATKKTIGRAIEDMAALIRLAKPELPPEAYGIGDDGTTNAGLKTAVTLENYTPTGNFGDEVSSLIDRLSEATGRGYAQIPNHTNPYKIIIREISGANAIETLSINLDGPNIVEAYPITQVAVPDEPPVFDGTQDPLSVIEKSHIKEFMVKMAFDPRVSLAQLVAFQGSAEGIGSFRITQIQHEIAPNKPWVTTIQGPFFGGDFLIAGDLNELEEGGGVVAS